MSRADSEFRLGEWVVVPDRHVLVAPGDERRMEPKAMETLLYLSQRAGETVTREELIQQVWKDTWGTDEVLSRIISVLRSQLGDDSRNPRFIETIPKVGYRLLIAPQPVMKEPEPAGTPNARRSWIPLVSFALVTVLILVMILARQGDEEPHTVAVIPFRDLSPDGQQEFFAVGLTDELILRLGRFPGLRVVSRRSLDSDTADVDFYIEGNVMLADERIRVFSELSSDEGISLWSESYESSPADYLDLQRGISDLIVNNLDSRLGLRAEDNPEPDVDPDTYTAYLQGNFLSRLRGDAPLRAGIESYRRALERQPDFDRARLGLARALVLLPYYSGEDEQRSFEKARAELARLRSSYEAEVAAIDAFIAFRQWRWQESSRLFRESIAKNSRLADTYVWYSQFQSAVGRNRDALKTAKLAYDLDSVSPVVNDRLATAWLWVNENELALARYGSGASLGFDSPVNPAWMNLLLRRGEFERVAGLLREIHGPAIEPLTSNIHRLSDPGFQAQFRTAAGNLVDQGVLAPRLELPLWVLLEDFDRVVATIEKYRDRKKYLDVEFLFSAESAPLRSAPEFDRIVRMLGLEAFWQASGPPDFQAP